VEGKEGSRGGGGVRVSNLFRFKLRVEEAAATAAPAEAVLLDRRGGGGPGGEGGNFKLVS
jgi:hypothetical protein